MLVLGLLVGAFAAATLLGRLGVRDLATPAARMRVALAATLAVVGVDHLLTPPRYLPMLPAWVPAPDAVILATGLLELAGAAGLLVARWRRLAALAVALYLLAVWPANWKVLLDGGSVAGLPSSRTYYAVRVLLQPLFVWWALVAGEWVRLPRLRRVRPSAAAALVLAALAAAPAWSGDALRAASPAALPTAQRRAPVPTSPATHTLTVVVEGDRPPAGLLRVALFAAAAGFPRDQSAAVQRREVPRRSTSDTVVFADVAAGRYAIAVHHDENGNGALDTNAFGIPREGWGASNDPRPRLRAPRFEEADFEIARDRLLVVRTTR